MGRRWSTDDDRALERALRAGEPRALAARRLGRSVDAVDGRRRALGLPASGRPRPWSEREDALLRAVSAERIPAVAVASRIGRSVEAVRRRQRALGLSGPARRAFTRADDDLLRRAAAASGGLRFDALARELRRSPDSLRLRAQALGLHAPPARRHWTAAEDALLRRGYAAGLTCRLLAARLPAGRTPGAVAARARKLGLQTYARRWTGEEEATLARLARSGHGAAEIGVELERSAEAVATRARRLGVPLASRPGGRPPWTPAELDFLRRNAGRDPVWLAGQLGRSQRAVTIRLRLLGVRRERTPHHAPPAAAEGLSAAQRRLLAREFGLGNGRRVLSLAARLALSPGEVKRLARAPR